jgi:hypothetical protein
MENLTIDAVKAVIAEAGEAIKAKAFNAEVKATEAFDKAEELLKVFCRCCNQRGSS